MVKMEVDWNLKTLVQTVSSFNAMPEKLAKKLLSVVIAALWNLFDICFIALQEHFAYG